MVRLISILLLSGLFSPIAYAVDDREVYCLASNIFFEARGQAVDGQYAVAHVTMNRVLDDRWPNTICGVVQEKRGSGCSFSWYCDGHPDVVRANYLDIKSFLLALQVAEAVLDSPSEDWLGIGKSTHYHTTEVSPYWASSLNRITRVGDHIFYE